MDNRPVGVFDSGLGGLTAARKIRSILPSENIIYFGDTSRVPYGGRSREILRKHCLLYTSPTPRDGLLSRMPSSA